jgi:hypothetical protein
MSGLWRPCSTIPDVAYGFWADVVLLGERGRADSVARFALAAEVDFNCLPLRQQRSRARPLEISVIHLVG